MLHVVCPEFRHEFIYVKNIVKLYKNSGGTKIPDGSWGRPAL